MFNIVIFPFISLCLAQLLKMIMQAAQGSFEFKNLFAYAGMPSAHAALVVSLATVVGLQEGWHSPLFGFALVFAFIIIRDAVGLRRYLGRHGEVLNTLVDDLRDDKVLEEKYPKLLERIGHTPLQVLAGGAIGFAVSAIGYTLFSF